MEPIKLSDLGVPELLEVDAWKVADPAYDEIELLLVPADKDEAGLILQSNQEVWCLSRATFSNGAVHDALSMCMTDPDGRPQLWSVWNGDFFVALFVPPASDLILESHGPENFCSEFHESAGNVFPIVFEMV